MKDIRGKWRGAGRGWRGWRGWRAWRGWRRRAAALAGAALLCAAAAALWPPAPAPARAACTASFPRLPPQALAHALADFTNHRDLFPHLGSWTLELEGGNYTHWWYSVRYACGARCAGRAAVRAGRLAGGSAAGGAGAAGAAPRHGPAPAHRVLLAHRACSHLPLLSYLNICEDWEIDSLITQLQSGGSRLQLRWAARGPRLAAGGGGARWPAEHWSGGGAEWASEGSTGAGDDGTLAARADQFVHRLRALLEIQT